MKVISILNQKGGVGKTTLSINLAKAFQHAKFEVVLVDADPQGSARDWNAFNDGNLIPVVGMDRSSLASDIKSLKGYDLAIVDGAPQLRELVVAAIKTADVVLIPVQPSAFDIWATNDILQLVKDRQEITDGKLKVAYIVNRQIQGTKVGEEVRQVLSQSKVKVFEAGTYQRIAYSDTTSKGKTIYDSNDQKAKEEIDSISNELWSFINE